MIARRAFLTSVCAAALALAAPAAARADDAKPVPVVATFSVLGDMVARVGGAHVAVTTLVGPDGDTHVYKPTPADARAVSDAALLAVNGLAFEGWLERLVDASDFAGRQVVATDGIDLIAFEDGHDDHHDDHGDKDHHDDHDDHAHDDDDHDDDDHDDKDHDDDHDAHAHGDDHHDDHDDHAQDEHAHDEHAHGDDDHDDDHDDHADGHGHDHGEFDPHGWQSLDNAVVYVTNIAAALAAVDPSHAADYTANRDAYIAELTALDAEIHAMIDAVPESSRTVVTSHDAFQYFGRAYGLSFVAPQGLSTESEASAKGVAALIEQIRAEGIKAVFVENITDPRLLTQIANETGAVIGGTLYPGALSPADGPAATYLEMMRHNAATIAAALAP